ncbi:SAM-dependent methyltransferase [hydrothermal vent metagenome]|uniref:SAM-dependent methyltransferase n=1 Tax=hydrothermal vent metagenome TaxID=652676 RepID=A0A3B0S0U8_9ZZZZ
MQASRKQSWSADTYDTHARFVSDLAGAVLDWLAVQEGEQVLDLGCGDGALTTELVKAGAQVTGVDASKDLLTAARKRELDVHLMDGEALEFSNRFDAVFSNAALHWMTNPQKVIAGVHKALKPGGRFVGEFGGHGNVAAIVTAMRAVAERRGGDMALAGPWFFPSPAVYADMLEAGGFAVKRIGLFPRPTPLKTGMKEWLKLFRKPFFEQFSDQSDAVLNEVEALLAPSLKDATGAWSADYVRLRFEAIKQ